MTDDDENAPETPTVFECPRCATPVEAIVGPEAQVITCPNCQEHVVIPSADGSTELEEEKVAEQYRQEKESELDSLRMRQIIAMRRAAVRSRTYWLLGLLLCATGIIEMARLIIVHVFMNHEGWHRKTTGYAVAIGALVLGASHCIGRAKHWQKESRAELPTGKCANCGYDLYSRDDRCPRCSTLTPPRPVSAPDFSTLSDGSQVARDLDDIR